MKRYSSGMYVRLAFAVAAHLNPEILLVDEVLPSATSIPEEMPGENAARSDGPAGPSCSSATMLPPWSRFADGAS